SSLPVRQSYEQASLCQGQTLNATVHLDQAGTSPKISYSLAHKPQTQLGPSKAYSIRTSLAFDQPCRPTRSHRKPLACHQSTSHHPQSCTRNCAGRHPSIRSWSPSQNWEQAGPLVRRQKPQGTNVQITAKPQTRYQKLSQR